MFKLTIWTKTWHIDQFEYAEFNDDDQFLRFRPKIPFSGKFGPKIKSCQFKLKFVTYNPYHNFLNFTML